MNNLKNTEIVEYKIIPISKKKFCFYLFLIFSHFQTCFLKLLYSDDEEHPRPSSAASSRSLPASKKKSRRKGRNKQPSEVGIRNVGGQIGFKGHQVRMLGNISKRF